MNDKFRAWVIISYPCCTCLSLEVVCVFVEIQQLYYSMKGKNNPKILQCKTNFMWRKPDLYCHSSMHLMYRSCLLSQNKEAQPLGPADLLPVLCPWLPQLILPCWLWARAPTAPGAHRSTQGENVGCMATEVYNLPSGSSTLPGWFIFW